MLVFLNETVNVTTTKLHNAFVLHSKWQIVKVLEFIAKKEGLQIPSGFAARIAEKSNRSLRRSILSFETCRVQQ